MAKQPKQVAAATTPATTPVVVYTLNPQAAALAAQGAAAANTLQRTTTGLGKAWRTAAKRAPNTRAQALAAIAAAPQPVTLNAAKAALQPLHVAGVLGSGTPGSYVAAFIKCGYMVPTASA